MANKEYNTQRIEHHKEQAEHHAGMADKDINREYHLKQESYHRDMIDRLEKEGSKKDIGPMGGVL